MKHKYDFQKILFEYLNSQNRAIFTHQECVDYISDFIEQNGLSKNIIKDVSQFVNREANILKNKEVLIQINKGRYFIKKSEYFSPNLNNISFDEGKNKIDEMQLTNVLHYLTQTNKRMNQKNFFRESLSSSIIEGSSVTLDNYADRIKDKNDVEIKEIHNQMNVFAWLNKSDQIMNIDLLKVIHEKMFFNIINTYRNHSQNAGIFKTKMNFIGGGFVPCLPSEVWGELTKLVKFYNQAPKNKIDGLIKAGFIHAWFESIHPFPDGNGRVGRLLINHYLKQHKIIPFMNLRISDAIVDNHRGYIKNLNRISVEKDYASFINWFINVPVKKTFKKINHEYQKQLDKNNDYDYER